MNLRITIICLLGALIPSGCHPHRDNPRLSAIESMQDCSPEAALDSLSHVDIDRLPEADRHYYEFLTVKLSDKAYVRHNSDSLIRKVLDYEEKHKGDGRYAEALYYAGRVYSDMGDYPRALSYYQQALDAVENSPDATGLKARISSQYALLLTHINLYEDAIPHVLTTTEISRNKQDTANLIHDSQLLAWIYMKTGDFERSQQLYHKALAMAGDKHNYHAAKSRLYLASIKQTLNQTDSALYYIKGIAGKVHPSMREFALSIAGEIYLEAGQTDSAFRCARELTAGGDSIAREMGYDILLNPELRQYISADSLPDYIDEYYMLLSARFNSNSAALAITQQSMYNYNTHVREKEKAEKDNHKLRMAVMWLVVLLAVMGCVILFFRNRNQRRIIELQHALSNIRILRAELEKSNAILPQPATDGDAESPQDSSGSLPDTPLPENPTEQDLRKRMQEELMRIYSQGPDKVEINPEIISSDIYRRFIEIAHKGEMVVDSSPLWDELERMVLRYSPNFKKNLYLLASGNLSEADIHTALLIKCGFRPTDMTKILGKSNGAIISRRDALSIKVLDTKATAKIITGIIRLL